MNGKDIKTNPGYEKRDVSAKKVLIWGIAGAVFIVLIVVALVEYFILVKEDYIYEYVEKPRSQELLELRERESEELNSYKLLDEEKGIYRIPIDRAMQLTIEEASK